MTHIINYSLPLGDRISMRKNLIQTFLCESPGIGTGDDASRYHTMLNNLVIMAFFLNVQPN